MTAPALPGMETSAEERERWRSAEDVDGATSFYDIDLGRLVRDFDRLLAEHDAAVTQAKHFASTHDKYCGELRQRADKAESERDRALAAGREAERAEIVAWLAEQRHTTTIAEWGKAFGLARLAIERGEHIPDAGNMVGQPSPDTGEA